MVEQCRHWPHFHLRSTHVLIVRPHRSRLTQHERRRRRCCNRRPQPSDVFDGGRTLLVESMARFGEPVEKILLEAALSEKHQGLRVDAPEALGIAELEFVLRYEAC